MKIRIVTGDYELTAMLDRTPSSIAFFETLPMTVELEDYHKTEKIAVLPKALTTQGAPSGCTPVAGDVAYYAPWGSIALFYKDFGYSPGLVRLGRIQGDVGLLKGAGKLPARIERVADE